jgi:DNA repair ATPase RecN
MSENELYNELEKAVKNNLNDVQMELFKREMERLQKIELDFVSLREEHKGLKVDFSDLESEYNGKQKYYNDLEAKDKDLSALSKQLEKEKTELYIGSQLLALRKENAEDRVDDHIKMIELIFRGPVFQKSVIENRTHDVVTSPNISDGGMLSTVQRDVGLTDVKSTITEEKQT